MSYEIVATTDAGDEVVDTAETENEANYLVREYALVYQGFGYVWSREED
jgi:hypothetical protein